MKVFIKVFSSLLLPAVFIGLLVGYSRFGVEQQNFTRRFSPARLVAQDTVRLKVNSFSFLRVDNRKILLTNKIAKRLIMEIDAGSLDTTSWIVPDIELKTIDFQDPRILMTKSTLVIADASIPLMLTSTHPGRGIFKQKNIPKFSLVIPVTDTSFIFRTYSTTAQQDIITLVNTESGQREDNTSMLEKQIDGVFCVDGNLLFNETLQRIVYVYYYRNQFITADPSLGRVTRHNTIDQTERASIDVDTYEKSGERTTTFKSPPHTVNTRCATEGNDLFVVSNVKAVNQQRDDFESRYTIDRYNLITGSYEGSLYLLPNKDRHELKNFDFVVSKDKLLAIFDEYLVIYKIVINDTFQDFGQDPK